MEEVLQGQGWRHHHIAYESTVPTIIQSYLEIQGTRKHILETEPTKVGSLGVGTKTINGTETWTMFASGPAYDRMLRTSTHVASEHMRTYTTVKASAAVQLNLDGR